MYYIKQANETGDYVDVNVQRFDLIKANEFYPANGFDGYCQCDSISQALILLNLEQLPTKVVEPFDPAKYSYSRYRLAKKLEALNLWDGIKQQMIDNNVYEWFVLANDLNMADSDFYNMYTNLKQAHPEIDSILKECVI